MIRLERDGEVFEIRDRIPLLPLRDVVIYPYMTIPLLVGRIPSVNAIEAAVQKDRVLFVLAQRRPDVPDPVAKDLYRVGTVVRVLQLFRLPDGTMRAGRGIRRARAKKFFKGADYMSTSVAIVEDQVCAGRAAKR
jgi:ATP-dependent Lon protease